MPLKKSGNSKISELDLEQVPIFNIEGDGNGLYHICTNAIGFKVLSEYLDLYSSDASESDLLNPYIQ